MSIRTTVTLENDVLERIKQESRSQGASFKDTLNDLIRLGLAQHAQKKSARPLELKTFKMGLREGLSLDDTEALLEYAEGVDHK